MNAEQEFRKSLKQGSCRWGLLPLALLLAAVIAGCQNSVSIDTRETHIPASSTMQAERPNAYLTTIVVEGPSNQVDAGRLNTDPITKQASLQGGMGVYAARTPNNPQGANCVSCHGENGKPPATMKGVPDLSDAVFAWDKTPQEFFKDLLSSPAHQAYHTADRQSLWDATFYAWTLHSSADDVVQGGILFGRYCSVCHGTKGRGDGNLANDLNPQPRQFIDFNWMVDKTDQRLYISISDGRPPSAMPAWKAVLSPTQRIQIVNYIRQFTYLYPVDIPKKMAEQPPAT